MQAESSGHAPVRPMIQQKLTRWIVFNVLIALLPLGVNSLLLIAQGKLPSIQYLSTRGELLLVSVAIAAAAIGELFPSGSSKGTAKIVAGGGCLIIIILSTLFFATVSATQGTGTLYNGQTVSVISVVIFVLTMVASGSCIVLAEVTLQ